MMSFLCLVEIIDKIMFYIEIFGWNINELKSIVSGKVLLSLCYNMVIFIIFVVFKRIFFVRELFIVVKDIFICELLKLSYLYVKFFELFNLWIMFY